MSVLLSAAGSLFLCPDNFILGHYRFDAAVVMLGRDFFKNESLKQSIAIGQVSFSIYRS
jgi:hypothetical protein